MLSNYGYADGSGEFFITIDSAKCDACRKCVEACPAGVLEIIVDDYDDTVAAVTEAQHRNLKYCCAACKPVNRISTEPCIAVCAPGAIVHSW